VNGISVPGSLREWIQTSGEWIPSYDPATGEVIAYVQSADIASYDATVAAAQAAFATWRNVPAPKRGEMIRDLGNLLREYKEPLG
jgi:aldehyde dehydrogenase (NAD+)